MGHAEVTGDRRVLIVAVASPGIWLIADGMGWVHLVLAALASVLITCVSLIAAHRLWDRAYSDRPETRERVVLFNLATAAAVAIGVVTLHITLFAIDLIVAAGLITSGVVRKELSHPASAATYVSLAALAATLATLGGSLGAALENNLAVREAAYGYRPDARTQALQQGNQPKLRRRARDQATPRTAHARPVSVNGPCGAPSR